MQRTEQFGPWVALQGGRRHGRGATAISIDTQSSRHRECDDARYQTCAEGSCIDDGSLYDGNFECDCNPGFLRDGDGLCTVPSVPPTITCPCDMQLVAGLHEERIPAPEGLTAAAFTVEHGGDAAPTFSRSDGAALSHPFTAPFAGGSPVCPHTKGMI